MVLALIVSACPSGPEDTAQPVEERDTGVSSGELPPDPKADCVGLDPSIGQPIERLGVELDGEIRGLVARNEMAWACGRTEAGTGFVASVTRQVSGEPKVVEERSLDAPCLGLVLGPKGLAVLQADGQVLWLPEGQAQLRSFAAAIQTKVIDLPEPQVWRGAWSAEQGALFLAGGRHGVLRFALQDSMLVPDDGFAGPKLGQADDVAVLGDRLIVADASLGLLVWNLQDAKLDVEWRDSAYFGRPGTQRIALLPESKRLVVAAGHAGAYLLNYQLGESSGTLEMAGHSLYEEPVFDVGAKGSDSLVLTASRLYENQELLRQSFPDLVEQAGFVAMADGPGRSLWLGAGRVLEFWAEPSALGGASLIPLLGFGTALHGVSGNATSELTFEVQGEGALWVQRPEPPSGSGLVIEPLSWPMQAPSCLEHSRFEAGQRFSLRVKASNPEKLAKTVPFRLRSNDAWHAQLDINVDLDTPRPRDRVGGTLPRTPLVMPSGFSRSIRGAGSWNWLEFVPSQSLDTPQVLERLYALAQLVQTERRNGRLKLVASVIIGGRYPELSPFVWADLERLGPLGVEFYFDERFAMHRSFARLPNGRLYPLRVLVDPESKIRYLDQHLGSATAVARYRELARGGVGAIAWNARDTFATPHPKIQPPK